ncbi:MAG: uncharacterized protein QOF02_1963 [Blastocatellia bacterium]|jgi:hypothetical protein|nr:uncharacterized protein [Blastocatellia bacterium]
MSKLELIEAVKQDDLNAVKALLETKELIEQEDEYGWTALHWAAGKGDTAVVHLLLEHGADVLKTGRDQRTPYKTALAANHVEVSKLLREAEGKAGMNDSSQPSREYCKAYYLKDLRQFPGWPKTQATGREESSNGTGADVVKGEAAMDEDDIAFLHSDLTVTKSMWRDTEVIFNDITPEWQQFCANVLNFKVAEDLDLIAQ